METFDDRISRLDLSLFEPIESQTSPNDRMSLLACQRAARRLSPGYHYLEVGSHLGGSIQPHLVDPSCERIWSIDKRPVRAPDARTRTFAYSNNSTQRMMELLGRVAPTTKIETIDGTTRELDPGLITGAIDLALIDGEHTDEAVIADFEFCRKVLQTRAAILFHDPAIVYGGISRCLASVSDLDPVSYVLPDGVFVMEFGGFALHEDPHIQAQLLNNHVGYLSALHANDAYRQFANRPIFRHARAVKRRVRRRQSPWV